MPIVSQRLAHYQPFMVDPSQPLLLFDTGVGGLSVFAKVRAALPQAPIVYAADYAGIPYGEKSEMEVATRVCALLGRLSERFRPRLIVIACNTASVIGLSHARAVLGVPIVGTVPAIKPAALVSKTGTFGLLGTKATIRQPYVDRLEIEHAYGKVMLRHAAPDLVFAAEAKMRGETPDPAIFRKAVSGLIQQPGGENMDAMILGCTHFPIVKEQLAQAALELGHDRKIHFVDGSDGIARRVVHLTEEQPWPASSPPGIFVTTGTLEAVLPYAAQLNEYGLLDFRSI